MFRWKRLLIVILAVLVFIIIQARNEYLDGPFRGILGNILNPIVYAGSSIVSGVQGTWNSYINLINVKEQNDIYKGEINRLTLENMLLQEKVKQAERLEGLARFYKVYNFNKIAANVVGISDGYIRSITLDVGSTDGVEKNDPVIGFQGLVGRVVNVDAYTCEVDVILNASSNVSVINSRSRVAGILRGDGKGRLYVDYYDRLDDIHIGDVFITSGLGRLYPKGIRVGSVSEVIKDKAGLFQRVYIEQSEDFVKLENVFIVKDF